MKENIILIKKLIVVGLVLLIFLILAEVLLRGLGNDINCLVIVSELLLAIVGGAIAGVIVELIEKIYKYRIDKRNNICNIFVYTTSLYAEFYYLHRSMKELLEDRSIPLPENLFSRKQSSLYNINTKMLNVDYHTFSKKNRFYKIYMNFEFVGIELINKIINETNIFKMACIESKIKEERGENNNKGDIYNVLEILDSKFQNILDLLDKFIEEEQKVDEWNKWEVRKKHIHSSYLGIYNFSSVEKYIKENSNGWGDSE